MDEFIRNEEPDLIKRIKDLEFKLKREQRAYDDDKYDYDEDYRRIREEMLYARYPRKKKRRDKCPHDTLHSPASNRSNRGGDRHGK